MAFPESASRNFNIRGALSSVNENHYSMKIITAARKQRNRPADQPTVKAEKMSDVHQHGRWLMRFTRSGMTNRLSHCLVPPPTPGQCSPALIPSLGKALYRQFVSGIDSYGRGWGNKRFPSTPLRHRWFAHLDARLPVVDLAAAAPNVGAHCRRRFRVV